MFCQFICASYVLAVVFIHIALKYTLLFGFFVFFVKKCKNAYYLMLFASSFALAISLRLFSSTLPDGSFFKQTITLCTFHLQTVEQ